MTSTIGAAREGRPLSRPQRDLLKSISERRQHVNDSYAPARKLVALGLAAWAEGKWGSTLLNITPAGRAALAAARSEDSGDA